jgi:small neutral amino acid transporter SnatA (MarC family)
MAPTTGDPVILSFLFFMILFIGGIWTMGISFGLPDYNALAFCGGLLLVTLALAFVLRQRGSATRRSDNWSGNATE